MCAYNAYIEKIFNTHHIKCIVSIMYNLYANSAKIRYFIEKTKISKLCKIPNLTGWNHVQNPSNFLKNFEILNMCLMGAYHTKSSKIVNFRTSILIVWNIINLYAHTTKIKKLQFLNPIYRLQRVLREMIITWWWF